VTQGRNGTAAADPATGVVTYAFANNQLIGDDTFTYTVRSAPAPGGLESNVAAVTITTTVPAGGSVPIAVNDGPFSVRANSLSIIPASALIANDLPNGGTINPASIQIVAGSVTGGTAVVDPASGNVTYAAGALPGNFGFSYTVANTGGLRSLPAAVAITILPATDAIVINQARFRTGSRRWDVTGTSTVPGPGNVVTVRLVRTNAIIGTATVDALGAWSLRAQNSAVIAVNGDQVVATSTAGGSATLAVQVRQ
jgi:hypothetical protein